MPDQTKPRARPLSPNIQVYRPQLTSVLSIGYRISGVVLSVYSVGLVVWLLAVAAGPQAYAGVQAFVVCWAGQTLLFGGTFAFFWHLCGGIRHLFWDAGYGYELRTIYASGWAVVVASMLLTLVTWPASFLVAG